jgi:hypothetical protein
MVTVGPNLCNTGADNASIGTVAWTDPIYIYVDDAYYAYILFAGGYTSHYLSATNYLFTIPAGGTIKGAKVEFKRNRDAASYHIYDNSIKLQKAGAAVGSDRSAGAEWNSTEAWYAYGSATDTWGAGLTPTDVNLATFGCLLSVASTGTSHAYVNCVRITIYYDPGLQLSESDVPPAIPWMMIYSVPEVSIYTPFSTIDSFIGLDLRLGSNGSMGSYRLDLPDEIGLEYNKAEKNTPIWFHMRQGPFERLLLGRIETPEHVEAPSVEGNILRLSGRGWGSFLLERNKPADYSSWTIYDAIMDPVNGLASACSEIKFGDYVQSPGTSTITTSARKRSLADVLDEFMIRAGATGIPYTYWSCDGQHPGEFAYPNLHFRPKAYYPAPISVCEDETLSHDRLSTLQFLENAVEVEYGSVGSTVTRNDTTSQALWHIFYKYVYAPFLTTSGDANSWGDKILNQTKNPLDAITFTVPLTLGIMPNYTLPYYSRVFQKTYEVSTVHYRIRPPRLCHVKVTAATTTL